MPAAPTYPVPPPAAPYSLATPILPAPVQAGLVQAGLVQAARVQAGQPQATPSPWAPPPAYPAPPTLWAPPAASQAAPPASTRTPPLATSRAWWVSGTAIGVGALAMTVSYGLSRDHSLSQATYLRYAMVLTLGVYTIVGLIVVTQLVAGAKLRWTEGNPVLGVATGLAVGGGLSGLLLALVSTVAGHLDPDPRIVTLLSEGDVPHIVATILITCVAAPLIEEILFRGLLLESLRPRFNAVAGAIWISALMFAIWHLSPTALRYYALLGALLGWLYTRHGLVCSMAAHFAFNGVLTAAALSVVLSAGPHVTADGLSVQLPSGWSSLTLSSAPALATEDRIGAFRGPSGAIITVVSLQTPNMPQLDQLVTAMRNSGTLTPGSDDVRQLSLPIGTALQTQLTIGGQAVTSVIVPRAGTTYELDLQSAGSVKATSDFQRVLRDLRAS
jgi:membrane protease YdiL (CAAX protease family)